MARKFFKSKYLPFSLRNKLLFFLLFFAAVPVLAFANWTLEILDSQSEEAVFESLRGLAKTKAQAIDSFTLNRISNIEKLSSLTEIKTNVKQLTANSPKEPERFPEEKLKALEKEGGGLPKSVEEMRGQTANTGPPDTAGEEKSPRVTAIPKIQPERLQAMTDLKKTLKVFLSDQKEFEEILVIDLNSVVLVSTYDGHEGKTAEGIEYYENGLKTTYLQHVFVSSITEKLTMVISTPIKDDSGNILGVLAARLNLDILFKLVGNLSGLRKTGETVVAKEIGANIVFMAPTRHDYKAALTRHIEIGSENLKPLQEAVRGGNGTGELVDYRDRNCLAAWEHVPSLDWGLMVKMDRDEAIEPYMDVQYKTILLTLVILFVGILLSIYISGALIRPIRELQDAADRISKGHLDVRLSLFSRDEIGELADSFGRMVASIKFLMEEKDKKSE